MLKILSKPKPKISISKKKLKEIKKDFRELKNKFSKEEINKFRKRFYTINNYASEVKDVGKNLSELEESILFIKSFNADYNDKDKNIDGIRKLFDMFKPKKNDDGFDSKRNNYI